MDEKEAKSLANCCTPHECTRLDRDAIAAAILAAYRKGYETGWSDARGGDDFGEANNPKGESVADPE